LGLKDNTGLFFPSFKSYRELNTLPIKDLEKLGIKVTIFIGNEFYGYATDLQRNKIEFCA